MYTLTLNTSINIEQLLFEMFLVLLLKKFNAEHTCGKINLLSSSPNASDRPNCKMHTGGGHSPGLIKYMHTLLAFRIKFGQKTNFCEIFEFQHFLFGWTESFHFLI